MRKNYIYICITDNIYTTYLSSWRNDNTQVDEPHIIILFMYAMCLWLCKRMRINVCSASRPSILGFQACGRRRRRREKKKKNEPCWQTEKNAERVLPHFGWAEENEMTMACMLIRPTIYCNIINIPFLLNLYSRIIIIDINDRTYFGWIDRNKKENRIQNWTKKTFLTLVHPFHVSLLAIC